MDLVVPLILVCVFTECYTEVAGCDKCPSKCKPGQYCDNRSGKCECKTCENNTYMDLENSSSECLRCDHCASDEVQIKPCTSDQNVQCDCKEGFYNRTREPPHKSHASHTRQRRNCQSCPTKYSPDLEQYADHKRKCQRGTTAPKMATPTITPTVMTPTASRPTTANSTGHQSIGSVSPAPVDQMPLLFLVGVLVTFLVLFCLLLLLIKNPLRFSYKHPFWSATKELEQPADEQRIHQGSSPTTLTFQISEETPMMNLSPSPAAPEHPAHVSPSLQAFEHRAARQDEQLEHWPAIVLYAIIKEVPLRRWKEFLRLLSVADQQLERVELEAGLVLSSMEKQYQMLRLWSQRSTASLNDVFSALHYMDLSGCAQLLQESLEKLQWRPDVKQHNTVSRSHTDHGFTGVTQDT